MLSRLLPWVLLTLLLFYLLISRSCASLFEPEKPSTEVVQTTILEKTEALGKLELIRYNFQEVTEIKEVSKEYFRIFKLGPDAKAILISKGEAVACINLAAMKKENINIQGDTVYIKLPEPEICYHKLDMENTRIFSLQTGYFTNTNEFIQKAYKSAEQQIEQTALNSGILEQARTNADLILKPLLEEISGKKVIFTEQIPDTKIDAY